MKIPLVLFQSLEVSYAKPVRYVGICPESQTKVLVVVDVLKLNPKCVPSHTAETTLLSVATCRSCPANVKGYAVHWIAKLLSAEIAKVNV